MKDMISKIEKGEVAATYENKDASKIVDKNMGRLKKHKKHMKGEKLSKADTKKVLELLR